MAASGADAQAGESAVIIDFNSRLATRVSEFQGNNTGVMLAVSSVLWGMAFTFVAQVNTWLWDSWTAFTTVLNDPTAYGFVDNTSYGNTGDFWGYVFEFANH